MFFAGCAIVIRLSSAQFCSVFVFHVKENCFTMMKLMTLGTNEESSFLPGNIEIVFAFNTYLRTYIFFSIRVEHLKSLKSKTVIVNSKQ